MIHLMHDRVAPCTVRICAIQIPASKSWKASGKRNCPYRNSPVYIMPPLCIFLTRSPRFTGLPTSKILSMSFATDMSFSTGRGPKRTSQRFGQKKTSLFLPRQPVETPEVSLGFRVPSLSHPTPSPAFCVSLTFTSTV